MFLQKFVLLCYAFALLLNAIPMSQATKNANDQRRFMRSLGRSARRILNENGCKFHLTPQKNTAGFVHWTEAYLKCNNLDNVVLTTVLCEKKCYNPVKCSRKFKGSNKLKGKPVMMDQRIENRDDTVFTVELPIACQCVSKLKKNCRLNTH
ncbi:uncharacterized protein LOC143444890 [Clavelina lepadiformis]|uniref:uncharacterized protein LOC143444890 n=1 Tax=Clavelina lepadiformis TaxID=159417 RepID=UPI004041049F